MENAFKCVVQGVTAYFDPIKIRRILLETSEGRCWTRIRELQALKEELDAYQVEEAGDVAEPRKSQLDALVAINLTETARLEGLLAAFAHEAFEFIPLNQDTGDGVGEEESLEALRDFMDFAEGKE